MNGGNPPSPEPAASEPAKGGTSQAAADSPRQKAFLKAAEKVEDLFLVMMEHGLFACRSGGGDRPATILQGIAKARQLARSNDLDSASTALARSELAIYEVIHAKKKEGGPGLWWRWRRIHQLPLLLYYAVILALLLNVASGWFAWAADGFWGVPAAAFGFGALGAVLRGLYFLHKHVASRSFRSGFLHAHLAAPWIGGLFGLFTYLLLQAGLLALDGTPDNGELATSPLALSLALLAGFKWEWIIAQIDRIGKKGDDGAPSADKAPPPPDHQPEGQEGQEEQEEQESGEEEGDQPRGEELAGSEEAKGLQVVPAEDDVPPPRSVDDKPHDGNGGKA